MMQNNTIEVSNPNFNLEQQHSIEDGYFVFTMMPSLRCSLNCPHCYLTLEQRRTSITMPIFGINLACQKVAAYFDEKGIQNKTLVFYWYGGEPTEMGQEYFLQAFDVIKKNFPEAKGYDVRHEILTSLLNIDESWYDIFKTWGKNHFQTSYDGQMRGKGYVKKWEVRVKEAIDLGLSISTISVVNHELVAEGAEAVIEYLADLKVNEASFLPFMLNEQNKGQKYEKYAPSMNEYSDFMIDLTKHWWKKKCAGEHVPEIGQLSYIVSRSSLPKRSNIPAQTMFLLPEGDFVLPDYRDGFLEYMKPFGNIYNQTFEEVLSSKSRKDYLRRQYTRNFNTECMTCDRQDNCIMEFWKENRTNDDCFGAKRYVDWVMENKDIYGAISNSRSLSF